MAGIRYAAALAVDNDVTQLLADLTTYFSLQQAGGDMDIRRLFVVWFLGQLINLDNQTARAVRTSNLEDPKAWGATLSALDDKATP